MWRAVFHRKIFFLTGLCILLAGCGRYANRPDALLMAEAAAARERAAVTAEKPEKNHLLLAEDLVRKQYYDVALVQLNTAKKKQADNPQVHNLRGICFRETGEPKKAEQSFKKAVSLDSDFAPAHDGLGVLYELIGNREKARLSFDTAIRKDPARPDFLNNLGFLEMKDNRLEQAEVCFRKSLVLDSEYLPAINNLAVCRGLRGADQEAFSLLKKHYSLAEALNNMGNIYRIKGDDQRAERLYREALKRDPKLAAARENLERLKTRQP
jgi:Flp pilus assembly protein TadD